MEHIYLEKSHCKQHELSQQYVGTNHLLPMNHLHMEHSQDKCYHFAAEHIYRHKTYCTEWRDLTGMHEMKIPFLRKQMKKVKFMFNEFVLFNDAWSQKGHSASRLMMPGFSKTIQRHGWHQALSIRRSSDQTPRLN